MTVAGIKANEETTRTTAADRPEDADLLALDMPMVSLRVHRPHLRLPRMTGRPSGRAAHAMRSALPPVSRLAYYGGLGAAAALGAIEWPVAVAIGVGTAIGQRMRGDRRRARQADEHADEHAEGPPEDHSARPESKVTAEAGGAAKSTPKSTARTAARATGKTETRRPGGTTRATPSR